MYIELPDLQQGYVDLIRRVAAEGDPVAPRGIPTREVLGATLVFPDVRNLLPVGVGRGVSPTFNAAGAACLVAGVSYHALLLRIAPKFASFDADGVDRERYGPRSIAQVRGCVRHLIEDPDTREAVVTIQPPRTAAADGGKVFPCTTSIQFLLRRGKLHMQVNMRSNDVWSGLSGDAWTFSQLQRTVAWALEAEPGTYTHTAASLHVYERDFERMEGLHAPDRPGVDVNGFALTEEELGFCGDPYARLKAAQMHARAALGLTGWEPAESVSWFAERVRPHRRPAFLCTDCLEVHELPGEAA